MIKTIKQACRFNPVIQDYRMSQGVENLADLYLKMKGTAMRSSRRTMSPMAWTSCSASECCACQE